MIRILRSGVVAGAIGALSVVVAGVGVATAANGGALILGHGNSATATTTLTDSSGTPLSLVGKSSKPPLKVNSTKQVAHLNASLLGGKSATKLATSGSGIQTRWLNLLKLFQPISSSEADPTKVASTGKLKPGDYYVTANVNAYNHGSATDVLGCFVGATNDLDDAVQYSSASSANALSLDLLAVTHVASPSKLVAYCYAPDVAINTVTMFAIRIAHSKTGSLPSSF